MQLGYRHGLPKTLIAEGHIDWKNNAFESCEVGLRSQPFQNIDVTVMFIDQ
jgi:hypothetical protein